MIAITGGIGSGKTVASEIISTLGYPVYSCDQTVKELYKSRHFLKGLKELFPSAVSGKLKLKADKKAVAQAVFNSKDALKKINDYTHPLVYEKIFKKAKKRKGLVFVEVPLLFESGFESKFDGVIIIRRNLEERIKSAMVRSSLTREQVMDRINSQVDYETLDTKNYTVIVNDGDIQFLAKQLVTAIEKFKR